MMHFQRSICLLMVAYHIAHCFATNGWYSNTFGSQRLLLSIDSCACEEGVVDLHSTALNQIKTKALRKLPKKNFLQTISFSWVRDLIKLGIARRVAIEDVWPVSEIDYRASTGASSSRFTHFLAKEANASAQQYRWGLLGELWSSPVARACVHMYARDLRVTGVLKAANTLTQFLPSLIVSRLLRSLTRGSAGRREGIISAVLLLTVLCLKMVLENQYFHHIISMAAALRGTLSAAIYAKALRLPPGSRVNMTVFLST
jgi:hypothetical protein